MCTDALLPPAAFLVPDAYDTTPENSIEAARRNEENAANLLLPTSLHCLANYLLLFDPVLSGMLSTRERITFLFSSSAHVALFAYAAIAALSWNLRWIASPPPLACFLCLCLLPSLAATLSRPRQSITPTADLD